MIVKLLLRINFPIFILLLCTQCSKVNDLILPDLPEKLCLQCVIDVDNNLNRTALFRKSFQNDYLNRDDSLLNDLSFSISVDNAKIYANQETQPILIGVHVPGYSINYQKQIPDSIEFPAGVSYSLRAKERDTPETFSEILLPEKPPTPTVLSVKKLILKNPNNFFNPITRNAVIGMSFKNDLSKRFFYSFIVEGIGIRYDLRSNKLAQKNLINYEIQEPGASGFSAPIIPFYVTSFIGYPEFGAIAFGINSLKAYFIDGSTLSGDECRITFTIELGGSQIYDYKNPIHIRLLSIPKELYLFEKSLYTYDQRHNDPFSEPVYLDGNIKGGEGIFAVCRSSETLVTLPWQEILSDEK